MGIEYLIEKSEKSLIDELSKDPNFVFLIKETITNIFYEKGETIKSQDIQSQISFVLQNGYEIDELVEMFNDMKSNEEDNY